MENELRDTIIKLEQSLWRDETRLNAGLMERTFADDLVEFGQSGRVHTREDLLSVSAMTAINATLPLEGLCLRQLAADVVLVTYVSELRVEGHFLRANRSSIWSLQESNWKLRFHQGTPIHED